MRILQASAAGSLLWLTALAGPAEAQTFEQQRVRCMDAGGDPGARIAACGWLLQSGQYDGPVLSLVHNNRGAAYVRQGDYSRAIADFNESIRLSPQNAGVYSNRGRAYVLQGEYARAIADFSEAIRLNPQLASAYRNRALAYERLGDATRAAADRAQAAQLQGR